MSRAGLGERAIIDRLARLLSPPREKFPLGFDDDVAAYTISPANWLVLKTDTLVGSTDVPPGMNLEQAARKAIVATVSDFAAKGVRPIGLMISLALPSSTKPSMVSELAKGISKGSKEYHCNVIGGDTSESKDLLIDCIAFGFASRGKILRRDGAKPEDVIAVTGEFGRSSAGLRILMSKRTTLVKKHQRLVHSVLHPVAKLETGLKLASSNGVNSSIDSSDGLAWSLHEISRLSRVRMILHRIPVAPEVRDYADQAGLDPEELALYGGEEYELVLTISKTRFAQLKTKVPSLIRVGEVEHGGPGVMLRKGGRLTKVEPRGWEHFRSRPRYYD